MNNQKKLDADGLEEQFRSQLDDITETEDDLRLTASLADIDSEDDLKKVSELINKRQEGLKKLREFIDSLPDELETDDE